MRALWLLAWLLTGGTALATEADLFSQKGTNWSPVAGETLVRLQVAGNTTSVAVSTGPALLSSVEAFNNGTTIAYVKLYNATLANTTCGSGTPVWQGMIPGPAAGGGGFIFESFAGKWFSTAITSCVTTGFADTDATAPAATTYVVDIGYR